MGVVEISAGAVGIGLLLSAAFWRVSARRRLRDPIRRALADPNPETRRAAVFIAAENGLTPYLDLLTEVARNEGHGTVRQALADVVLRNQWEPADSPQVLELRLWAHSFLESTRAPATGRGWVDEITGNGSRAPAFQDWQHAGAAAPEGIGLASGMGRSSAGAPADALTGMSGITGLAGENGRHGAHAHPSGHPSAHPSAMTLPRQESPYAEPATSPVPRTDTPAAGAHQRKDLPTTIVTGAGGPAGVAVIRALRAAGHPVVGVDSDGLAAGLRLAEQSALVPRHHDPTFVEALCELAGATGASLVIPTLSEELGCLNEGASTLRAAGLTCWLPPPDAVEICLDKWEFAKLLDEKGLPGPRTNLGSSEGVPGAWVVKPRFGRGSRDVYVVDRVSDLPWVMLQVPQPIVQTRLTGREFTVDALVDHEGNLAGAVPRWRLETKGGISTKGKTFSDDGLRLAVAQLLSALRLTGPSNVQGFMTADGTPWFVEVNPRFSGGLPLSLAAGADLVGEYVRGMMGQPLRPDRLTFRPGVTMIRYFEELFE